MIGRRLLTVIVATASLIPIGAAYASGHRSTAEAPVLFKSSLSPSTPDDPAFHGVAAGGLPWVLDHGMAQIDGGGVLLNVRGLVIPIEHTVGGTTFPAGTALPVTTVSASLYCGADTNPTAAFTTGTAPITPSGNALIRASITIPDTCQAPIILLHPNGIVAAYIAVSGFGG
jgi:hypothetical protein